LQDEEGVFLTVDSDLLGPEREEKEDEEDGEQSEERMKVGLGVRQIIDHDTWRGGGQT